MDYGLHHKKLAVELAVSAHALAFDHWAVNLQHTLPRMEVRHKGERKTVCVTVNTRSPRPYRFRQIRGAYRSARQPGFV